MALSNLEFNDLMLECMKTNDYAFVYHCAKLIASSKNPSFICDFAEYVPLADTNSIMELLENGIISTGDINQIYEFLFCMKDCNKNCFNQKRFEEIVVMSQNAKLIYYMLECVPDVDKKNAMEKFVELRNPKWTKIMAENEEMSELVSAYGILELSNKLQKNAGSFFPHSLDKYNETSNPIDIFQNIMIDGKTPYICNEYDEYVSSKFRARMAVMFTYMLEHASPLDLYEYFCSVEILTDEQKNRIIDKFINGASFFNAKYLFYLAEYGNVNESTKKKLLDAIKMTQNEKYINKVDESSKGENENE